VSCENCRDILEKDEVEPPCFEGTCYIPDPGEQGRRILEIYNKLITLQGLVDSGTILKMYDATIEDLELLAFLKEEIDKMQKEDKENG